LTISRSIHMRKSLVLKALTFAAIMLWRNRAKTRSARHLSSHTGRL
jgi:hypothetical protein